MANTIKLKRGSGSDPGASDLSVGEVAVRTDTGKLFTKKDDNSVTEIGVTAVADGSITSAKIADGAIVNADVNASAAIAGSKIDPDFGSQNVTTTGTVNTGLINASSASDQILNLNSSDNGGVYLAFKRSGSRKAYFGYGGTGNTISLVNEISDGDINIAGSDGGSQINVLNFDVSDNGKATFSGDIVTSGNISGAQGSFTGDVDIASNLVHTGDTDTKISFATNTIKFDTDSSERLRINSSGNVGIGTTSPSYRLDVQTASGDANMRLRSAGTGTGDDTVFRMQVAGTVQDNFIMFGDSDDSNAGQIRYNHSSNFLGITVNAAEQLRINSSGDVGIGTTSPSTKLDVNGTVTATAFAGALTGNVTGNASGSSGSCTGNAATATALATARNIAGVSFDGTANISLNNNAITNGAGYITDLVSDTSPQLGGNLDTNDFEINLDDNHAVNFGASNDLTVKHSGSTGVIDNVTGDLHIKTTGSGDDIVLISNDDIELQPQAGENGIKVIGNGAVELYHDNSKKFETASGGVSVTGNIVVSGTVDGRDLATDGTKLDGIASGATNVTNTNQLTNGAGFITSADGGNAATLDSIDSSQFLRSDTADSASGLLTLSGGLALSGKVGAAITAASDGSTITLDLGANTHQSVTLGGNRTFAAPSNQTVGQSGSIFITQDGTGSRTASFNSAFKFVGGTAPTLSTAASAVDRIDYVIKSSNVIHCAVSLDVK